MSCRRYFGFLNSIGSIRLQGLLKFEWMRFTLWDGQGLMQRKVGCYVLGGKCSLQAHLFDYLVPS